ncbi:MAG: autotransporter-associated beta strand repeat-containing protein [Pirellulales bacterium]
MQTYGLLNGANSAWTISGTGAVTTPTGGGNLYVTPGRNSITISAPINNNGSSPVTLVLSGSRTLTLSSTTSNFSGGIILNGGVTPTLGSASTSLLSVADNRNLGGTASGLTFNGSATVTISEAITIAAGRTITINNGSIAKFNTSNRSIVLSGRITGTGGLILEATSGDRTFTLSNTANDFQGPLAVGYTSNRVTAIVSSLADSATATGVIRLGGASAGGRGAFQWNGSSSLVLNNRSIDLWGVAGSFGILDNSVANSAVTFTINTPLMVSATGNKTLILQGTNTGSNTFAGTIANGTSAVISLSKQGTGNWILAGAHTFTGALTGEQGTLMITGQVYNASTASLRGGRIVLDAEHGSFGSTVVLDSGVLGGWFAYDGSLATGSKVQSFANLTLTAGEGRFEAVLGSAASMNFNILGTITRSPGATGNFTVVGGVNGATNRFTVSGQAAGFIDPGVYFGGSRYAWMDAAGTFIRAINYGVDAGTLTSAGGTSINPTDGTHVQTAGAVTAQTDAVFGTLNIAGPVNYTLASSQTLSLTGILKSGGGTSVMSGGAGLQVAGGTELIVRADAADDVLQITSPLLNATRVTKSGAGAVILNSTAVNLLNVDVGAGLLSIDYGALPGPSFTNVALGRDATFELNVGNSFTAAGVFSGAGFLQKTGSGTLFLSGANTFLGTTNILAGVLSISAATQLGPNANDIFIDNNAVLQLTAGTLGTFGNTATERYLTVGAGGATLDLQVNQAMDGDSIFATGPITKIGNGTWSVTSTSSLSTVPLFINDGVLLMTGNTMPVLASMTIASGATFNIEDETAGTWTLSPGGKFTFSGTGEGGIGALRQTHQSSGTTFTSTLGAEVVFATPDVLINTVTDLGTLTFNNMISGPGGFEKAGPGTLRLPGAYTYAGGAKLTAGNLVIGSQGVDATASSLGTGTFTLAGGTLSINGTIPLDFSSTTNNAIVIDGDFTFAGTAALNLGTGAVNLGASLGTVRTVTLNGPTLTIGGVIADGASGNGLTKTGLGTLILTGDSTLTGTVTNTGGILQIGVGGASGGLANALAVVNDGILIVDRGSGSAVLPSISGFGSVVLRGAGTKTFIGTNTYFGTTTLELGTLRLDYTTSDTSKLSDSTSLTTGRSVIELVGGTHVDSVASLTLTDDLLIRRLSGSAVLNLNSIYPGRYVLDFDGSGIAQTDNPNVNGILGAWATVTTGGVTRWAVNSTGGDDGLIIALDDLQYVDVTRLGPSVILDTASMGHVRIINGGTSGPIQLGTANAFLASLTMSATEGPAVIDLDASRIIVGGDSGGAILMGAGASALTIGATLNEGTLTTGGMANGLAATLDINVLEAAGLLTIDAVVADNGGDSVSLRKLGLGRLVLNGTNTFSGTTTLQMGSLYVTSPASLGGAGAFLRLEGGTLILANASSTNFNRATTIAGDVEIVVDRITSGASVTHTLGGLIIGGNTLTVNGTSAATTSQGLTLGAVTSTGATNFIVNNVGSVPTLLTIGSIANSAGSTITFGGSGNITVTGVIGAAAGGITKTGGGTLTLVDGNTFSGLVSILGGIVSVSGTLGTALGNAGNDVTIDNNAILRLVSGTLGTVNGTNRVFNIGPGGATLDLRANQTFSGGMTGTGTITKTGSGVWSVGSNGNPGYTGLIVIAEGELRMTSAQLGAAAGMTISSGATFTINDDGNANWNLGTGAIYQFSGTGASAGFGALRQTQQGGTNAFTSTFVREVVFNTPNTLVMTVTPTGTIAFTGPVSGTGGIEKGGPGTLTISSATTYAGNTTVTTGKLVIIGPTGSVGATTTVASAGTIAGTGKVANLTVNAGTVAPGVTGAGKLTSDGSSVVLNNSSTFQFEFRNPTGDSTMAGTNWDFLDITAGSLTLSGSINLRVDAFNSANTAHATAPADNLFNPSNTYQWLFARASGGIIGFTDSTFVVNSTTNGAGVFGTGNAYAPVAGYGFFVSQVGNELYLNYAAVPEPSSVVLVGLAGAAFAAYRRRRRQQSQESTTGVAAL